MVGEVVGMGGRFGVICCAYFTHTHTERTSNEDWHAIYTTSLAPSPQLPPLPAEMLFGFVWCKKKENKNKKKQN